MSRDRTRWSACSFAIDVSLMRSQYADLAFWEMGRSIACLVQALLRQAK
jgi:hypothetical protein